MSTPLVFPRPNAPLSTGQAPIRAPSEEDFISTFGALLPPARYVELAEGRAAYYVFPGAGRETAETRETAGTGGTANTLPTHALLVHGVQTPALGLLPLVRELRSLFPSTTFALLDLWGHGLSDGVVRAQEGALFEGLVGGVLGALGWDSDSSEAGGKRVALVGYSFGAVVSMGFVSSTSPASRCVASLALVAPAGLLRKSWFSEQELGYLSPDCSPADEEAAADWTIRTLEGGELTVPADWREKVAAGEIVAQALKQWQLDHHAGHAATVTGIFRDGGVFENEELFQRAKGTGVPLFAVLGELDGLTDEQEVRGLGVETRVVEGVGHGVVREREGEVARLIGGFWRGL
ncbi:Alpha/Beta hydrolase protein [Boeremia exigua]|uniref:Alpha/Beta hydrolase protein n=1 Tax=Boeremia exigua TaxID=749465 RepID=UPI001E8D9D82|nr:Alpha/Beta hydrolase protein [Boeremia exigua]KAH6637901.1 Alpha/Beta hydrolase protein [Boeremia exigua]